MTVFPVLRQIQIFIFLRPCLQREQSGSKRMDAGFLCPSFFPTHFIRLSSPRFDFAPMVSQHFERFGSKNRNRNKNETKKRVNGFHFLFHFSLPKARLHGHGQFIHTNAINFCRMPVPGNGPERGWNGRKRGFWWWFFPFSGQHKSTTLFTNASARLSLSSVQRFPLGESGFVRGISRAPPSPPSPKNRHKKQAYPA